MNQPLQKPTDNPNSEVETKKYAQSPAWFSKWTISILFILMTLFLGVVGIAANASSRAAAAATVATGKVQPVIEQVNDLEHNFETHQLLQEQRDQLMIEKITHLTEVVEKQGDEFKEIWRQILSEKTID
jgi:flagellar biosynthesis/type III secretory pathway M-ring protein FliF/YscJ